VPDRGVIQCMTDAIRHRGPDGEGLYVNAPVALGHRRLAILDLSSAGSQPMCNEDQTVWITYNGEIYNFMEVRRELESCGHRFRSNTDTEVVIHAYQEWGVDCLARLNGMFAFGLWDEPKQRLWLVRDRLGVKPLFYARLPHALVFGSEIKALLQHPALERKMNFEALAYYLALNYTPAPHTLFEGVRQLLPGHYLLVNSSGQLQDIEYWDLAYVESNYREAQEYVEEFRTLLEDSVRLRLVSDVPFGAFLSGGVDSSSVAYWMSGNMEEPIKTFSIGFDEASFSELRYARQVAERIRAEHHEQVVTAQAAGILPRLVWHAEEPTADSSMVAVYYLAEMTRRHVKMALSGDGADETMAGYETYQAHYVHRLYRHLPNWIRRGLIAPLVKAFPVSEDKVALDFKLRRFVTSGEYSSEDAHALWRMIFGAEDRARLLAPVWSERRTRADVLDLYRAAFARTNARDPLNRMLYVDTRFYLPNDMLVKIDRMTMAHGLEARGPFLDYRLVELLARVPASLKLKGLRQKKYILKAAMRGRLPDSILDRKKEGFNLPNAIWLKQDLRGLLTDHLSPQRIKAMGFLDSRVVQALEEDHFKGKADNSHQLWCLLTLSLWWQQFIVSGAA
jgi:asparagine synthase (glutamine-hydrolysing)